MKIKLSGCGFGCIHRSFVLMDHIRKNRTFKRLKVMFNPVIRTKRKQTSESKRDGMLEAIEVV